MEPVGLLKLSMFIMKRASVFGRMSDGQTGGGPLEAAWGAADKPDVGGKWLGAGPSVARGGVERDGPLPRSCPGAGNCFWECGSEGRASNRLCALPLAEGG